MSDELKRKIEEIKTKRRADTKVVKIGAFSGMARNSGRKPKENHDLPAAQGDTKTAVSRMNEKHCVIANLGGKCLVMEWVPSGIHQGLLVPSYQAPSPFKDRYLNQHIAVRDEKGNTKKKALGHFWFAHPDRLT